VLRLRGPACAGALALLVSLPAAALAPPVPEGPPVPFVVADDFAVQPALAYRPSGDLLVVTDGPDLDPYACLRGYAPCAAGPLLGYHLDRFTPQPPAGPAFQVGEGYGTQLSKQIEIAPGPGSAFLVVWEDNPRCDSAAARAAMPTAPGSLPSPSPTPPACSGSSPRETSS